jgi:hypothetical protein
VNLSHARLIREQKTIRAMIDLFCRDHHGAEKGLCPECMRLLEYARSRLDNCPFGAEKSTCANCSIHCYRPNMRQSVQEVMRYSGPRMALRHPILSILHMLDGRKPSPALPGPRRQGGPKLDSKR